MDDGVEFFGQIFSISSISINTPPFLFNFISSSLFLSTSWLIKRLSKRLVQAFIFFDHPLIPSDFQLQSSSSSDFNCDSQLEPHSFTSPSDCFQSIIQSTYLFKSSPHFELDSFNSKYKPPLGWLSFKQSKSFKLFNLHHLILQLIHSIQVWKFQSLHLHLHHHHHHHHHHHLKTKRRPIIWFITINQIIFIFIITITLQLKISIQKSLKFKVILSMYNTIIYQVFKSSQSSQSSQSFIPVSSFFLMCFQKSLCYFPLFVSTFSYLQLSCLDPRSRPSRFQFVGAVLM